MWSTSEGRYSGSTRPSGKAPSHKFDSLTMHRRIGGRVKGTGGFLSYRIRLKWQYAGRLTFCNDASQSSTKTYRSALAMIQIATSCSSFG